MTKFRLRDNTKIRPLPNFEEYIGEPLEEVLSLLEKEFGFHSLKDCTGTNDYRLITIVKHCHRINVLAYRPENTDNWLVVDAFIYHDNTSEQTH